MRSIQIRCRCCNLPQMVTDRLGEPPELCAACSEHRGADDLSMRRRAEAHLAMVTERLDAARNAADVAVDARDRYREKMHAAYGSRELAVRRLRTLSELHEPMGKGRCSCGRRACESMQILDHPWVRSMVQRLNEIEAQREEELRAIDGRDDWSVMAWDQPFAPSDSIERTHGA